MKTFEIKFKIVAEVNHSVTVRAPNSVEAVDMLRDRTRADIHFVGFRGVKEDLGGSFRLEEIKSTTKPISKSVALQMAIDGTGGAGEMYDALKLIQEDLNNSLACRG